MGWVTPELRDYLELTRPYGGGDPLLHSLRLMRNLNEHWELSRVHAQAFGLGLHHNESLGHQQMFDIPALEDDEGEFEFMTTEQPYSSYVVQVVVGVRFRDLAGLEAQDATQILNHIFNRVSEVASAMDNKVPTSEP